MPVPGAAQAGAEDPVRPPAVLVVGAGPVGLTVAYELARRGVPVRLVDRAGGPATTSRALAVHARTLEVLDQMGVLPDLLPRAQRVSRFSVHRAGRRLIRFDGNYAGLPTRYPFSVMVDQVSTEEVLRTAAGRVGVGVEWGTALERLDPAAGTVRVLLRHPDGGAEDLAVPWLVGADGGHSTVRRQLGLRLLGDRRHSWLNADVRLDPEPARDSNHLLHTGAGTLMLLPFPEPGKWRVVDTVEVSGADQPEVIRARLAAKISAGLGRPVTVATPTWVSVFTVQQRMIQRMRVGRCFVAGDAAHVHSPASGQGMNTGIQDGYNLAWKLAEVIRGHADEAVLDSYDAERVPIGATLLRTTRTATTLVGLRTVLAGVLLPAGLGLLGAITPMKRRVEARLIRGFCGLALHYAGSPLTYRPVRWRRGIQPGYRVGCDAEAARAPAGWGEVCRQLRQPEWTLLGFAAGDGCRRVLAELAAAFRGVVTVRTVTPAGESSTGPAPLADPGGAVRAGFGVPPGGFALIRPDGYLAAKAPLDRAEQVLHGLGLRPVGRG